MTTEHLICPSRQLPAPPVFLNGRDRLRGRGVSCERFINRRSRIHDQMVQAARSGKRNIVEGSLASHTFIKTERKLGDAWANLDVLLVDFKVEKASPKEGGFIKKLYQARIQARDHNRRP